MLFSTVAMATLVDQSSRKLGLFDVCSVESQIEDGFVVQSRSNLLDALCFPGLTVEQFQLVDQIGQECYWHLAKTVEHMSYLAGKLK